MQKALNLVWEVFCEFEAPEYSEQGVEEFRSYIQPQNIAPMLHSGEMQMWGCYLDDKLVGIIAASGACHINLFFIRRSHQGQGLAWKLFNELRGWYRAHTESREITVNSSPYAVEIYQKLGFIKTGSEQVVNGIRFTPMRRSI